MFYMALGRAVGVCVLYSCRGDNTVLSASLSSALLKFMVDEPITADDVRAIDPLYFKNRMLTLLEPGGVELMAMVLGLDELFFVDLDDELEVRGELKPGGAGLRVTEQNKAEYVALLSEQYLCGAVRQELAEFLAGFWDIIPRHCLSECQVDEKDLGMLISGIEDVDVADWRTHTTVRNASAVGPHGAALIDAFWSVLEELDGEQRARCLQFVTGLSRLPPEGFVGLLPRFELVINSGADPSRLPTAHTCFNRLDLPPYRTKAALADKLLLAISEGAGTFGLR